jgi:hypothetical protein
MSFIENGHRAKGYGTQNIEVFISDHGGEFVSNEFEKFYSQRGIFHNNGPKHTSNFNAHQEKHIQTVNEKINALLSDANLTQEFWPVMREATKASNTSSVCIYLQLARD